VSFQLAHELLCVRMLEAILGVFAAGRRLLNVAGYMGF
jgi:hypothetical protein